MANTISKITTYAAQVLDEQFAATAKTAVLEAAPELLKFVSADTVMLPDITMDGLGDYSRSTGYPAGDVTLTYTPYKLSMDRGRSFSVDAMDDEETAGVAFGKLAKEFVRTKVVPEVDAYRLSKLYASAATANVTNGVTIAANKIISLLNADDKKLIDNEVEPTECVRFISSEVNNLIADTTEVTRMVTTTDYTAPNGLNFSVKEYNGVPMIVVPKARFYSAYDFGTNGFAKTSAAVEINWLTVHMNACVCVKKHEQIRVFDPQTNQTANAWKFDYRLYHDIFVPKNKQVGITACTK